MQVLTPKINLYQNHYLPKVDTEKKNTQNQTKTSSFKAPSAENFRAYINFKGYTPETKNAQQINQIIDLLKSDNIEKIAIVGHDHPDGDAIGSMVALKHMIKQGIGKNPEMFLTDPLPTNFEFIDPNKEINVLNPNYEPDRPQTKTTPQEAKEKYGKFDLVIVVDTAKKSMINQVLQESIIDNDTKIIKIDHHPMGEDKSNKCEYYGDINFVDDSKESGSQVVMQFAKPLGLNINKIDPLISNALSVGLLTDSRRFDFARGPQIYLDAAELAKTSNLGRIAQDINKLTIDKFNVFKDILNNKLNFTEDKKIAYFVVDKAKDTKASKFVREKALEEVSKISGLDYYFYIIENSKDPNWRTSAAIRSTEKTINHKVKELGGGGHPRCCGLGINGISGNELAQTIIDKLNEQKQ